MEPLCIDLYSCLRPSSGSLVQFVGYHPTQIITVLRSPECKCSISYGPNVKNKVIVCWINCRNEFNFIMSLMLKYVSNIPVSHEYNIKAQINWKCSPKQVGESS